MTCCTIFTKRSKQNTGHSKIKKEIKNAESAFNSHVAGTEKKDTLKMAHQNIQIQ